MTTIDHSYTQLLLSILSKNNAKGDRTGVGTISQFGTMIHFNLSDVSGQKRYLPLINVRKVPLRYAFEELMFMLNGYRDTRMLESKKIKIWTKNTSRKFLDERGLDYLEVGDMGRMYGAQLRQFHGLDNKGNPISFDQLDYIYNEIAGNPDSRRIITSHFNPAEASQGVLYPCHLFTQFAVNNGRLDCLFFMRSSDTGFGLPINLNYYALMTHFLAESLGLLPGQLVYQAGDTHIYKDQLESGMIDYMIDNQANHGHSFTQPELEILKPLGSLDDILSLTFEDIKLTNYNPLPDYKNKPPMAE